MSASQVYVPLWVVLILPGITLVIYGLFIREEEPQEGWWSGPDVSGLLIAAIGLFQLVVVGAFYLGSWLL